MAENITLSREEKWLTYFQLITKPEQSGKTFLMIQQLIIDSNDNNIDNIINIIFCDNNLLLTQQTKNRIENTDDLISSYQDGNGEIYLEFSSHSRTEYNNKEKVFHAVLTKNIKHIICCTNGKRIDDIYELVIDLNKSTNNRYCFKIWIDEVDKFTKSLHDTFIPLIEEYNNIYIVGLTATPKKIFDNFDNVNVLPIENTTNENYHGWLNNKIITLDNNTDYLNYAKDILSVCYNKNKIKPGTKWFIPGNTKKKSHIAIKDMCIDDFNMVVIIVNGNGLQIYIPNNEVIIHKKDDELNTMLIKYYNEYDLNEYALVLTGNICIGRGISILSNEFMIDYAILSICNNKCEASQLAGRLKGNIKNFQNYKIPIIFTTPQFNEIAITWENQSRNLARLAFDKEQIGLEPIISKNEMKTCGEDYEYIVHPKLFKSYNKAKEFLQSIRRSIGLEKKDLTSKKKNSTSENNHESNGPIHIVEEDYKVTSKLLKQGESVKDLTKEHRITINKCNNLVCVDEISPSRCISSTNKGSRYLILPIYNNENTPPNKELYQVRYLRFKNV